MAHSHQNMAYIGQEPWHRLGSQLPPGQPSEVWQKSAGMDFEIKSTEVLYSVADSDVNLKPHVDSKVLYRRPQ